MIDRQRLDKWLWHARFAKTRSAAQELVRSGAVRVNRVKADAPSHPIRVGDVLTVAMSRQIRAIRVLAFAERRGPASAALALYTEAADPLTFPPEAAPLDAPRPDKRDRRRLQALKRTGTAVPRPG